MSRFSAFPSHARASHAVVAQGVSLSLTSTQILLIVISVIRVLGTGDSAVKKTDTALPSWSLPSSGEIGSKQAMNAWPLGLEHLGSTSDLTGSPGRALNYSWVSCGFPGAGGLKGVHGCGLSCREHPTWLLQEAD